MHACIQVVQQAREQEEEDRKEKDFQHQVPASDLTLTLIGLSTPGSSLFSLSLLLSMLGYLFIFAPDLRGLCVQLRRYNALANLQRYGPHSHWNALRRVIEAWSWNLIIGSEASENVLTFVFLILFYVFLMF